MFYTRTAISFKKIGAWVPRSFSMTINVIKQKLGFERKLKAKQEGKEGLRHGDVLLLKTVPGNPFWVNATNIWLAFSDKICSNYTVDQSPQNNTLLQYSTH